jgi:lipopolysaccharide transport system permease protein
VRYKQTVLGIVWSVLRPFLTMVVFTVVFGRLAKLPSDGIEYPILVFAALLPWQLFSNSLSEGSSSIVANANMISKVYFPRLIAMAGSIAVSLVDFLISFAILLLLMAWYHLIPGWRMAALPGFLGLTLLFSVGCGLWFSALNVRYRDFRYVVPFIVQFGLLVSPVGFSSAIIPPRWQFLYSLNPLVGVIDGFRWAILGGETKLYWPGMAASVGLSLLIFALGLRYFRATERTFADVI